MGKSKVNFKKCEIRQCSNLYGSPMWSKLNVRLKKWIINERENGIAMSATKIRIKAWLLAEELEILKFHGESMWCYHFMKQKHLAVWN